MKRSTELMAGSATMLCLVASCGFLFCLAETQEAYTAMGFNFPCLSAVMLGSYYVNCMLTHRGIPLPLYATAQALLTAAAVLVFTHSVFLVPTSLKTGIFIGALYALCVLASAVIACEPVQQNGIIGCFDALAVLVIMLLLIDHYQSLQMAGPTFTMCGVSMVATIIAMMSIRAEKTDGKEAVSGSPAGGRAMLGAALLIVVLLTVFVACFASGQVYSLAELLLYILNLCIHGIVAAAKFAGGLLLLFFNWLAQFVTMDDVPLEADGSGGMRQDAPMQTNTDIPGYVYVILAVIAAAAISFIIYRLRRIRIARSSHTLRRAVNVRRKSEFKNVTKRMLAALAAWVRFRYYCLHYRKTAAGLFAYCEWKMQIVSKRRAGESGEKFLRRLAGNDYPPETSHALTELAGYVERDFYRKASEPVPPGLYRTIHSAKFCRVMTVGKS